MKKITVNILCSTGITLMVLGIVGTMLGGTFIFISSVFQCLLVNIIIHIGLLFTKKYESNYPIVEITLDLCYTIAVVLVSGAMFNWYSSTPIWILLIMAVVIYLVGILLSIIQMRREINEINHLLRKRNRHLS